MTNRIIRAYAAFRAWRYDRTLRLEKGDFVVFKSGVASPRVRWAQHEALRHALPPGVTAVMLSPGSTLDHIPSDQLHRWGLYRLDPGPHTGRLWVVGRLIGVHGAWELQGIYSTEVRAVQRCRDTDWFVGPCPLDATLPEETVTWPGVYYPLDLRPAA